MDNYTKKLLIFVRNISIYTKMSILSIGHLGKKVHDFNIFVYIFNDLKMLIQLQVLINPYINK